MSFRFTEVRNDLEQFLRDRVPIIQDYRLELRSPTGDRAQFDSGSFSSRYNTQGSAVTRVVNVVLCYSVQVATLEIDTAASDRLIYTVGFVQDKLNQYSTACGLLSREIRDISAEIDHGVDASREEDDYFVWSFISFTMEYQEGLEVGQFSPPP